MAEKIAAGVETNPSHDGVDYVVGQRVEGAIAEDLVGAGVARLDGWDRVASIQADLEARTGLLRAKWETKAQAKAERAAEVARLARLAVYRAAPVGGMRTPGLAAACVREAEAAVPAAG